MTQAQKTAKAKFKQAIEYRKKTGVTLKEAFAHIYGKKVGAVKKTAKKVAVKKVARKVAVKKVAKKRVIKKKITENQVLKSIKNAVNVQKLHMHKMGNINELEINKGDIMYSSWGYDQTNIDFYFVIKKTGTNVYLVPMSAKVIEYDAHHMTGTTIPNQPNLNAKPIRRKVNKSTTFPRIYVKINSFEYAYKWDGKPKHFSNYA